MQVLEISMFLYTAHKRTPLRCLADSHSKPSSEAPSWAVSLRKPSIAIGSSLPRCDDPPTHRDIQVGI